MYHREIHLYLVNQKEEIVRYVKHKKYDSEFSVKVLSSPEITPGILKGADIAIIDVSNLKFTEAFREYETCKGEKTIGVFCADRKKAKLLTSVKDSETRLQEIWPAGMEVQEFSFYFNHLMERIKLESDLWLSNSYLDATINSIPDLVWYKDKIGAHLKVNQSFCKAVNKTMDQIEGRGHYYIWDISADEYAKGEFICMESEYEVMAKKETCVFDENVLIRKELRKFKTYKTPLFDFDGSVMGTVGLAKDVTSELRYRAIAEESSEFDALTGAYTRKYLENYLESLSEPVVIYYLRINNLNVCNLNRGYEIGDSTLRQTVNTLDVLLNGTEYLISRTGGSDFIIARCGQYMDEELKSSAQVIQDGLNDFYHNNLEIPEIDALIGYSKAKDIRGCFDTVMKEAAQMVCW